MVVNAQNWDKTNPVEYYGAYQIALDQHNEMQLRAQNWDKTNPVEYYSALPMAMAQYNLAVMGEQGWDSTHTEEYYSVPPSTINTLVATDSDELSSDTATCDQC